MARGGRRDPRRKKNDEGKKDEPKVSLIQNVKEFYSTFLEGSPFSLGHVGKIPEPVDKAHKSRTPSFVVPLSRSAKETVIWNDGSTKEVYLNESGTTLADRPAKSDRPPPTKEPSSTPPHRAGLRRRSPTSKPRPPSKPAHGLRPAAPGEKNYYRIARLFPLSLDTTLADVLAGIAATAPVGRVLDIQWDRSGRVFEHRGRQVRGVRVLFDHDAAPVDLVRLAKQGTFRVRAGKSGEGESVHVAIYPVAFATNVVNDATFSRVMCVLGNADVESFSEAGIRGLLLGNAEVVRALGPLGLEVEAVRTKTWVTGQRLIVWQFLSNQKQCRIVMQILRRHFYRELIVVPGRDPCWDERLYPRQRTSHKDFRVLAGIAEAYKAFPERRQMTEKHSRVREGIKWSPEEQSPDYNGRDDASTYAHGKRRREPWELSTDFTTHEPGDEPTGQQDAIDWEAIVAMPGENSVEDDIRWAQDGTPGENSQDDTTQQDIASMASSSNATEKKPKTLDPDRIARVEEWLRLQKVIDSRHPRRNRSKSLRSGDQDASLFDEASFDREFRD